MRYGVCVPNFGNGLTHPDQLVELAALAEETGWDGFFIWDHILWRPRPEYLIVDPWVVLGAVAGATGAVRIGTLVTPVARRRPWKLARETATLDRLSNGRLILGVGLGSPATDFSAFGEPADESIRAALLDEGLEVLELLWHGHGGHAGRHFCVDDVDFGSGPLAGRVPVWVGGCWPRPAPMRRAARWDGAVFLRGPRGGRLPGSLEPNELSDCIAEIERHRGDRPSPFDHVAWGWTGDLAAPARVLHSARYEQVGATWWVEAPADREIPLGRLRARVAEGPSR